MIIHHHEFLVRGDARIKQLAAQVEIHGGTVDRNEAEESKRAEAREHAKQRADLSLREVTGGFPVLHRQQVVFLWGAIEAVVEDTLVAWLKNENLVVSDQRLRKIKVSLADFSTMSELERNYYLVSELQHELKPSHRSSLEVFESIMHRFGLVGAMDPQLKRNLIELEYVRNVLLHRRGIVDSRFLEGCPWTNIQVGTAITPDEASVGRYTDAVLNYAEVLLGRIDRYFESKQAGPVTPSGV